MSANRSLGLTYTVTNTGNVPLSNVTVTDDRLMGGIMYLSGDVNGDMKLDVNETWVFQANGTAQPGVYNNTGMATGSFTDDMNGTAHPMASDPSSYYGAMPGVCMSVMKSR